jgi:decaprenyl-phosphate phosphoribosyltransferase
MVVSLSFSLKSFIALIRVHQWIKNFFIFIPSFFAGNFFESGNLIQHLAGFLSFSLVASAIYTFNDVADIEKDRLHPTKCYRPVASGAIPSQQALIAGLFCMAVGGSIATLLPFPFLLLIGLYVTINIGYIYWLKNLSLIDINLIAFGFLIRVFSGAIIADVVVSKWLVIMTFLLALLLGFGKRRDDVLLINETGVAMRKAVAGYNAEFVNVSMVLLSAVTVVAYIMYTVSPEVVERIGNDQIYLTSFFVIIGILRYLQLALVENKTGSPTKVLLKDRFIQLTILGWILVFGIFLY